MSSNSPPIERSNASSGEQPLPSSSSQNNSITPTPLQKKQNPPHHTHADENEIEEQLEWEEWKGDGSFAHHMLAGSCAGVTEHLSMYPVDTFKTHLQAGRATSSSSSTTPLTFLEFVKKDGFLRLWRGAPAVLFGCIPSHAAYFSAYEAGKVAFGANSADTHTPLAAAATGALATTVHDGVLTPMDVVKQRLQLGYYKGVGDCIKTMAKEEGIGAFWRSYPTTLLMNMPYAAVVVSANESLKKVLMPMVGPESVVTYLLSGAGAGALAAAATCPLDVIKTRLQTAAVLAATGSGHGSGSDAPSSTPAVPTGNNSNGGNSGSGSNGGQSSSSNGDSSKNSNKNSSRTHNSQASSMRSSISNNGVAACSSSSSSTASTNNVTTMQDLSSSKNNNVTTMRMNRNTTSTATTPIPTSINSGRNTKFFLPLHTTYTSRGRLPLLTPALLTSSSAIAGAGGLTGAIRAHAAMFSISTASPSTTTTVAATFKRLGALDMARLIVKEEGFGAFFKGVNARIAVNTPSQAISWATYETIKSFLSKQSATSAAGKRRD